MTQGPGTSVIYKCLYIHIYKYVYVLYSKFNVIQSTFSIVYTRLSSFLITQSPGTNVIDLYICIYIYIYIYVHVFYSKSNVICSTFVFCVQNNLLIFNDAGPRHKRHIHIHIYIYTYICIYASVLYTKFNVIYSIFRIVYTTFS